MESLRITSLMAENADFICRAIARYIAERWIFPLSLLTTSPGKNGNGF